MVIQILTLVAGLALILLAAEYFTNGIEHLGEDLNLGEAAVGSVLAAVGTAMPETLIPVVAILSGHAGGHEIGVGAILGAPFMLSTLAFSITALAAFIFARRRISGTRLSVDRSTTVRDLSYFIPIYTLAIAAALVSPGPIRWVICAILIAAYIWYVWQNIKEGGTLSGERKPLRFHVFWMHLSLTRLPEETRKAFFHRAARTASENEHPHTLLTYGQVIVALGIMLLGARTFVTGVEHVSDILGISAMLVALVIAPIATELPEKFNSVIWMRESKDTLALGNITGAMVFQSSIPATLGIALTEWPIFSHSNGSHGHGPLISTFVALVSAVVVLLCARHHHHYDEMSDRTSLSPWVLLVGLPLYIIWVTLVLILKV